MAPLSEALGRVLAEDCFAGIDQPPFDRSPLDGYALFHGDVAASDKENPAVLTVSQHIYAGDTPAGPLAPGEAARVTTGAPLPPGATCVARQENTDYGEEQVKVYVSLKKHQNYVFRGEDLPAGRLVAAKGVRLRSAHIGTLAGQGFTQAAVYPRPQVGLLSTGSELAPAGEPLPPGMIYDSNSYTLAARVREWGGQAQAERGIADDPAKIAAALEAILAERDLVATTGGVSVGAHDYMPRVGEILGAEVLFHGLGYKPGGVALALRRGDKLILCLSGNPFAALVSFELLAGPVFRKMAGQTELLTPRVRASLRGDFPKASASRRFLRAKLVGGEVFTERDGHGSGSFSSLTRCDCLIDIPAGSPPMSDGAAVDVILL
jgi:molybdopterin molybdotransferase